MSLEAQITVDIHPNFRHVVGGMDSFDRSRMLLIHADQTENDWEIGNNFGNFGNLRDSFLLKYDIYLGRNTGGISYQVGQVREDPLRTGYADPVDMTIKGNAVRNSYQSKVNLHKFESRNSLVIASQHYPFYPDGTLTGQGWSFANGTATGEYMGRYINEFHGGNGQPKPTYVEIMNEPLYEFVTEGDVQPIEIFNFHNEAADAIRLQVPDVKLGGYCAAFPNFEVDNFQRWHERWKLFMDTSGDRMDFWSIHYYDFNLDGSNLQKIRRGSYLEGTFDMIDQYSMLSYGETKPYVISEYGGRALSLESQPWSPYRDWLTMKSFTGMLLQFSERPQDVLSAIPFVIVKALWGIQANGSPYPWRLMRKNNELPGQTGVHYVYTEMVKFFQLWSDVRGIRIDTRSTDPDIQCNAYVDGNKMYLILNNLYFTDKEVDLNIIELHNGQIQNVRVKNLYYNESISTPQLDETNHSSLGSVTLGAEGSAIIEFTYAQDVIIDELVDETKYFAETYLQPIVPFVEQSFQINNIEEGTFGEAVLRLGMGRPHGSSLQPTVTVNGFEVQVPENYMGYDQAQKTSWFGVIEIPVPLYYLQENNEVKVRFNDEGGHISTILMRVYNHSKKLFRTDAVAVESLTILPSQKYLNPASEFKLLTKITPITATEPNLNWVSSDTDVVTVDEYGQISALTLGSVTITATTTDGVHSASSIVNVVDSIPFVSVFGFELQPDAVNLVPTETFEFNPFILPADASNTKVFYEVGDPSIASINEFGIVTANLNGTTHVIGTTEDEGLVDTSYVTVASSLPTNAFCSSLPTQLIQDTNYSIGMGYSSGFSSDVTLQLKDNLDNVLAEGSTTSAPGLGLFATFELSLTDLPILADDYSLTLSIKAAGMDTVLFSCTAENVSIVESLSVEEELESAISISPNPTSRFLNIQINGFKKEVSFSLFDLQGKIVIDSSIINKTGTIDLGQLVSGTYIARFESDGGYISKRIVVNQ